MLQPFCHKDFAIRSLGDRIKDLNQCVNLYPDIPKDKAFGAYYTPIGGKISIFSFVSFGFTSFIKFRRQKLTLTIDFTLLNSSRINEQRIRASDSEDNCSE